MSQVFFILLNNNRVTESVPKTAHSAGFLLMTPLVIHKDKILRTSELQLRSRQHNTFLHFLCTLGIDFVTVNGKKTIQLKAFLDTILQS